MFNKKFNSNYNKQIKTSKGSNKMICDKNEPFIKLYKSLFNQTELSPTEIILLSLVYDREKLSVKNKHEFFDKKMLHYYILTSRQYLADNTHVSKSTVTRSLNDLRKKGLLISERLFNGGLKIFTPKFKYNISADKAIRNNKIQTTNIKQLSSRPQTIHNSSLHLSASKASSAVHKYSDISEKSNISKSNNASSEEGSLFNLDMSVIAKRGTKDAQNAANAIDNEVTKKYQHKPLTRDEAMAKMHKQIQKIDCYYVTKYESKIIDDLAIKIKANPKKYNLDDFTTPGRKAVYLADALVSKKVKSANDKIKTYWKNKAKSALARTNAMNDDDVMSKKPKVTLSYQNDKLLPPKKSICSFSHNKLNHSNTLTSTLDTTKRLRSIRKSLPTKRKRFSYKNNIYSNKVHSEKVQHHSKNILIPLLAKQYTGRLKNYQRKLGDDNMPSNVLTDELRMQSLADNQITRISMPRNAVKSIIHFSGGCPEVFKSYIGALYESKYIARKSLASKLKHKLSKKHMAIFFKAFRFETNLYYRGAKHSLARALEDMLTFCSKSGIVGHWKRYYLSSMINYFVKAAKNYLIKNGLRNIVNAMA